MRNEKQNVKKTCNSMENEHVENGERYNPGMDKMISSSGARF